MQRARGAKILATAVNDSLAHNLALTSAVSGNPCVTWVIYPGEAMGEGGFKYQLQIRMRFLWLWDKDR